MTEYRGQGDLYEGDKKLRRVGYDINVFSAQPVPFSTLRTSGTAEDPRKEARGRFHDIDGSGGFHGLRGINRVFTLRFDGGGFWECTVSPDGEAESAGDFVPPTNEG